MVAGNGRGDRRPQPFAPSLGRPAPEHADPAPGRTLTAIGRATREQSSVKIRLACTAGLAISLISPAGQADSKGCIKGAVVGGVAGHMAGHGKLGAAAGCAVGHSRANKKDQAPSGGQQQPQQN